MAGIIVSAGSCGRLCTGKCERIVRREGFHDFLKGVRIRIVNFPWIRLSMDGAKGLDVSFVTFPEPSLPLHDRFPD